MLVYAGGEAWISVTSTEMTQNNSEISFKRLPCLTSRRFDTLVGNRIKLPVYSTMHFAIAEYLCDLGVSSRSIESQMKIQQRPKHLEATANTD